MTCNTDRLSEYLDDELTPGERREIDLHLAGCGACREVLSELALVKETAAELADVERLPDADLWPGVQTQLPAERGGVTLPFAPRRRSSGISLSWMQAVAASVALVAASSGAMWLAMRGRPEAPIAQATPSPSNSSPDGVPDAGEVAPERVANFADATYEQAVNDLRAALEAGRNRLDPQTIQVLEKNLAAIDQAIEQARKALEADPANVSLNSYLASVRKKKLELLRTASELTQSSLP